MRNRFLWSTVVQLLGLVAVAVGVALVYLPAGVIVGGLSLGLLGWVLGIDPKADS